MRNVTLVDLGAGPIPAQTPAPVRQAAWFPVVHQAAVVPPVTDTEVTPVADGILLEWPAVESGGALVTYIIERGPAATGPWEEIARTTETRYFFSDGTGHTWFFRITPSVRGVAGQGNVVVGTPELTARQTALDQEVANRLQGDLKTAADAAADASAKASAARDAAKSYADGLFANVGDLISADEWSADKTYPNGDFVAYNGKLYRSFVDGNIGHQPDTSPAYWEKLGEYASAGEAIAASLSMSTQNASDISAQATRIDGVVAKLPADGGRAASTAQVASEATARADGDIAMGLRVDAVNVALGDKASVTAVNSLNGRVDVIDGKVTAQGEALVSVSSKTDAAADVRQNIMPDPTFANNRQWDNNWGPVWSITEYDTAAAGPIQYWNNVPCDGRTVFCDSSYIRLDAGQTITASVESRVDAPGSKFYVEILYYDGAAAFIGSYSKPNGIRNGPFWYALENVFDLRKEWATTHTAPVRTVFVRMRVVWVLPNTGGTTAQISFARPKIEVGNTVTPYNDQMTAVYNAGATLALKTRTTALESQSSATLAAVVSLQTPFPNMLLNPTFATQGASWALGGPYKFNWEAVHGNYIYMEALSGGVAIEQDVSTSGNAMDYAVSADIFRNNGVGVVRIELAAYNSAGVLLGSVTAISNPAVVNAWERVATYISAPIGATKLRVRLIWENTSANNSIRRVMLNAGKIAKPYSDDRTVATNASAVIDLSSRVNPLEATATATTAALASLGGSGNLFENSDFSRGVQGWSNSYNPGGWQNMPRVSPAGPSWEPAGGVSIGANLPGVSTATSYGVVYQNGIQAEAGKRYIISGLTANHRCKTRLAMRFMNAAGVQVAEMASDWSTQDYGGGASLSEWQYRWYSAVAPAGTATVDAGVWATGQGASDAYFFFTRPMLEQASPSQTQASPWSPGFANKQTASAITTVSASVNAVSGRVAAKITNALDVNGNISGTVSENDGVRSSFSILATIFRVISSASTGLEWQNGYLRAYSSAIQLVLGINFGSSANLCFWYGPNVGASNCSKANGTIWFDNSGGAYFGGSLSAGVKKNAVQTTTTVTVGTELVNGPFDTNGNVRSVIVSFNRSTRYVSNAFGAGGFSAGAGSNTATVQVYRRIGSAAETLWQTLAVGGSVEIFNEPDAPDRANSYWAGAITVNDTSGAADTVTYRAVITAFASQTVSHPGTINSITSTQNLSVISVEN